ncbi:hypothetical protein L210DRAFT_933393 [Boletus edulis BED1]|uniref:Uncharacterized protein n=1 Tax=Boletus edulis BED1 TaxID=1328754 RepID=A0AAD4C117_BOLED|nr:hypothetical protein L210DRAFT_933393 [Boletus edulis BED1]
MADLISQRSRRTRLDVQAQRVLVVDWLVLAHHPAICAPSCTLWIELCRTASTDPLEVLNGHINLALKHVLEAFMMDRKLGFTEASYRVIGTLAFVAPQAVLPHVMDRLWVDIDAKALGGLSEEDLGIWETPEGTMYVGVLVTHTKDQGPRKCKGVDIARWETELRQSRAGGLFKEAQALVQAQLVKDATVRERLGALHTRLVRALAFVRSVV